SPMMAMASPSAADSPSPLMILSNVPPLSAVISIVALSVSTSASVSFASNLSPSLITQRAIWPSSIVGDSFGIKNFSARQLFEQNRSELFRHKVFRQIFGHVRDLYRNVFRDMLPSLAFMQEVNVGEID